MTKVKLEAVQRELDIRRNMLASGQLDLPPIANVMICAANGEVDALLTEIRQLRLEIASILNDAGCPPGQGPGVLPPWTYRRLDDLLKGESESTSSETIPGTSSPAVSARPVVVVECAECRERNLAILYRLPDGGLACRHLVSFSATETAEGVPKCVGCGKPVPDYVLQATQPRPTGFICAACAP